MLESEEIIDYLNTNNIHSFWHFTNIRNLRLIKDDVGLLSKQELEIRTLSLLNDVYCGGDKNSQAADKKMDNWDKISLSFTPHTPMFYRKRPHSHLIMIEIKTEVAQADNVYFTNKNALKKNNGQRRDKGLKGLENIKFEYINIDENQPNNKNWFEYVQAEILVPYKIKNSSFKNIHFVSQVGKLFAELLCKKTHPLFKVTKNVFSDLKTKDVFSFSFIDEITFKTSWESEKYKTLEFESFKDGILFINDEIYELRIKFFAISNTSLKILNNGKIIHLYKLPSGYNEIELSFFFIENGTLDFFLNDINWLSINVKINI